MKVPAHDQFVQRNLPCSQEGNVHNQHPDYPKNVAKIPTIKLQVIQMRQI